MKKSFIVFFIFSACIPSIRAQDYNIQGDKAMEEKDYQDARSWYSEGLESCNIYSIQRLTEIWKLLPDMRESMRYPILRSFECLKQLAENKNQEAIMLILDYYNQGIGVERDTVQAAFWFREAFPKDYRAEIPENSAMDAKIVKPKKSLLSDRFYPFLAYTATPTMPVGITAGTFDKFGFYLTYRTSIESVNYEYECNDSEVAEIGIENPPYRFEREKWISNLFSGGVFIPLKKDKWYFSIGGGYGVRDYYREIVTEQHFKSGLKNAWCYNTEASYKGALLEVGALLKWKKLILTGGINSIQFKDLDIYLGLGITL
ncbi:MAG: hypothetical protein LBU22_11030 [Dysgonamonadaceae bacterium]|jgi:hypothetical protein|nr:hypothetical protein [Dysgonamonadaceae bacterium]